MRRTMNMNNFNTKYTMANTKMNVAKALKKLDNARGDFDNLEFKASEVGLKGAQMMVLKELGVVSVIDKEEVWFKIDDDTMKRGEVNIYLYDVDTTELLDKIKAIKIKKIEEKIKCYQDMIRELYQQLDELC